MVRNQYSYWLTAEPIDPKRRDTKAEAARLMAALQQSELAEDLVFEYGENGIDISGEVKYDDNTIEENTSLSDYVKAIAAQFPSFKFVFEELDEEDHSNGVRTEYADGSEIFQGFKRTLDPEELDALTARDIISYLEQSGHQDAANIVTAYIKSNPGHYGAFL